MVRAAAKNFAAVAVLVDPERYGFVLDELRESAGELSLDTRRELAAEAFAHTAGYDIAIANWFSDTESFPERHLERARQGHRSRLRREPAPARRLLHGAGARRHLLSMVTQHGGKQLSFNNLLDLDAATTLVQEFTVPACVIVKHGNPCGCALAATPEEAYRKALAGRSGVGVRRRRRRQPPALARARRARRRAVRRGAARAGLRRRRGRPAAREAAQPAPARSRTSAGARRPASATPTACSAAC